MSLTDEEHALKHRGPLFEIRELDEDETMCACFGPDGDGHFITGASARWPEPFDDDDLDQPEDDMWWIQ